MADEGTGTPAKTAGKRRAKLKQRAGRHEKQLSGLLSQAKSTVGAPAAEHEVTRGRRGRRGATLSLYQAGKVTEAIKEPAPSKYGWQSRLLAKRFPKCTPEQIAEALEIFAGDTDKASIICERQSRNAGGPMLSAKDEPLTMEELEVLGAKQLAHLAKKLHFNVVGNANEMRQRLAALVGLTPDVMVRLEWILDAALAAKLPSIDREGAATIRAHIAEGRFTAAHYIQMFTERLRISEADAAEELVGDTDEVDSEVADDPEMSTEEALPGTPAAIKEGALRHNVYRRLRNSRCGKHLRIRDRLSHADKLRCAGTLASSTLGSADFRGLLGLGDEDALGSTWKRASQLLQFELDPEDGSQSRDEEPGDLPARRRRDWRESEHDVDGWFSASANSSMADVLSAATTTRVHLEQHSSKSDSLGALVVPRGRSPPVDMPSSPVRRRRQSHSATERFASIIGQLAVGSSTADPDLETWRAELQRRRVDAGRIGLQLSRRLPDLDLKPVWLDEIEGGHLATYDRLATAGRARSPRTPI